MQVLSRAGSEALIDATDTMYPARLVVVTDEFETTAVTSTHYGYVVEGIVSLQTRDLSVTAGPETYFAIPGALKLRAEGRVTLVERIGFRGLLQIGVLEARGRLAYIDGCSDTLLVAPPRLGDPCLNHLHFPAGTRQSVHRHPSIRLGVVARGGGSAYGPRGGESATPWEIPLCVGDAFLLEEHEAHAFRTEQDTLDVVAFHPDSDWGPTDDVHPMRNRTYVAR